MAVDAASVICSEVKDKAMCTCLYYIDRLLRGVCFHTAEGVAAQLRAGGFDHLYGHPLAGLTSIVNQCSVVQYHWTAETVGSSLSSLH